MKRVKKGLSFLLILVMLVSVCIPMQAEAAAKTKINKTKQTLYIGQTVNLKITGTSEKVTWSTSNKKVATVSTKGKVTAKKKGTATITAKVSNKKYTCKVTVKAPKLSATSKKLNIGKTYSLKLTGATAKNYSSSNKKIATVDRKGKITARKTGKATITVKDTKGRSYTCKITVNKCTHTWNSGKVTKKATCIATGVKTYTCKICKATKTENLKKNSHIKGEWEVTKKAICDENGTEVRRCTVCKEVLESRIISYIGHDYEKMQTVPPTCTEHGYTLYGCECGEMSDRDYVAALGHDWGEWVTTKEPTEEETGLEKRICDRCKEEETNALPEKGHEHNYTEEVVTAPTCTKQGYTTHSCKCGDSYADTYVDATGHSYEDTVTEPTCNAQGYTTHTCACGDSYVDTYVDADENAHTAGDWVVTLEPTYTEVGTQTKSCTVCGKILETEEIPVLELTNGDAVYTITLADGSTTTVIGHYDTEKAEELFNLVNEYRAENGLTELTILTKLQQKADIRGYQTSYYWEHKTPAGQSAVSLYGYSAENLAWYVTEIDAQSIFEALKNCEDHDAIMKSTYTYNYTGVSVFCKKVGENDYEYYWVQIFM